MYLEIAKSFPLADRNRRWILVVGGGLLQMPVLEEARKMGLKTIVTDLSPTCACAQAADYFLPIDVFDVKGHVRLVLTLRALNVNICGVMVAGIDATITGAIVARTLGLPGVDPLAAFLCKHKPAMRARLQSAGLPVPRWAEVETSADVEEALREVGFPCIVKNTDSSASRGTKRFFARPSNMEEFFRAVEDAREVSASKTALIEELWRGPEQTVETLFDISHRFWPCFITDRLFADDGPNALEIGLEHPTRLDAATQQSLYEAVRQAAEVLGITVGAAKADTILTKDGPRIIEMTTRLSGGFDCQYLVPAATGKNIIRAALLTCLGKPVDPLDLQDWKHRFAVSGSVWPGPGVVRRISGIEEARALPGIEGVFLRCKPGDEVRDYKDCAARVCFVIASDHTREGARQKLDRSLNTIRIETQ
ncbi:MAG: ATP-grasp domain-containing protein [Terriglobales bacterium]